MQRSSHFFIAAACGIALRFSFPSTSEQRFTASVLTRDHPHSLGFTCYFQQ